MKIKKGYKWKSIEGPSKGNMLLVLDVSSELVTYKSCESGIVYTAPRKHFEQYVKRVQQYWNEKNKSYKNKKRNLKNNHE